MASPGDVKAGGAYVQIDADTAPFQAAMGLVQDKLKGLGGIASKLGPEFLIVGATIGAIANSVKVFAQIGGEMKQMQETTGVAANTLMGLKYAADQSESSIGAVTTGIRFLQRGLVNAGEGSKQAIDGFKNLGLSFQALQGMDTQGQLMAIADAIKALPTATQRTAAAMDVFGRGGAALVPLLKQGSGAIQDLMSEAEKLGYTMSGDQLEAADNLGDTWSKLGTIADGLAILIGSTFAPAMQGILDLMVSMGGGAVKGAQEALGNIAYILQTIGGGVGTPEALKEAKKNADERNKYLEKGARDAATIAQQEIKTAQEKEAAIKASEDRGMAAQKGVLGASDIRIKAQYDAGIISMQEYYSKTFDNQRALAQSELDLARKRTEELTDAKAKQASMAEEGIAMNRLLTIEEERRAAISKANRDEGRANTAATLSARLAVSNAESNLQEASLTTAYQREIALAEDAANQKIITEEEMLKRKKDLTQQYNDQMKGITFKRIDDEMSFLVSQMEKATTEAEKIQLQGQMDVLKLKAQQVEVESKKPLDLTEKAAMSERAISVGKIGAGGFQEQFGAIINRTDDGILSENKKQSSLLESIEKNTKKTSATFAG